MWQIQHRLVAFVTFVCRPTYRCNESKNFFLHLLHLYGSFTYKCNKYMLHLLHLYGSSTAAWLPRDHHTDFHFLHLLLNTHTHKAISPHIKTHKSTLITQSYIWFISSEDAHSSKPKHLQICCCAMMAFWMSGSLKFRGLWGLLTEKVSISRMNSRVQNMEHCCFLPLTFNKITDSNYLVLDDRKTTCDKLGSIIGNLLKTTKVSR